MCDLFLRGVFFFRGVVCSFSLAHFEVKETMSKEEVGGKEGDRGTLFRSLFSSIEEKTKMEEGIIALRQIFTTLKTAFFGRFSSKLSLTHPRTHFRSKEPLTKCLFYVIFTKNTFSIASAKNPANFLEKSALFSALHCATKINTRDPNSTFRRKSSTFCAIFKRTLRF